jgi:transposase InsO family protein
MSKHSPDPKAIALWRYELIEDALPDDLTHRERGKILRRVAKAPVRWPTGATRRVSLATLYRWLRAYFAGGLRGLRPKPRKDKGKPRRPLPREVVDSALRHLEEDPEQSLTFLLAVLRAEFRKQRIKIARSTLQRRLKAHPGYERVKRARAQRQRRGRFVAPAPHRIWQTDAKGPFPVRLTSGEVLKVHVISILDDATRAILAALVVLSPDLGAAVLVFQLAALRWGLPWRLYADRASIFDSHAFRAGLADLGSHRIKTKPRNAPVRGKIEAYHRVLGLWFTKRLGRQRVVDLVHLQQLLDGVIGALYQPHTHRGIKVSPQEALGGKVSERTVPPTRLHEAFLQEKRKKAHPTTGEVELQDATWLVPDPLRGKRVLFLLDPTHSSPPLVTEPETERRLPLRRAEIRPEDIEGQAEPERWGPGPLQTIYDDWAGRRHPQAEPGFGLPEIYALLAQAAGRTVPRSEREAALVQRFYRKHGPLPQAATEAAFSALVAELGPGRALKTYLDALASRIRKPSRKGPQS